MISILFSFLIIIGVVYFIITNRTAELMNVIINSPEQTFNLIIKIFPLMALWLGIMNIANKSGLLNKLTQFTRPFLTKLFPEIPKDSKAFNYISSNFIMNLFGLSNAATPMGIKAMSELQVLNKNKDTASNSMITFLIINTVGLTLIPTTIISLRMSAHSSNPTLIIIPTIIVSLCSLILGLLINYFFRKWLK